MKGAQDCVNCHFAHKRSHFKLKYPYLLYIMIIKPDFLQGVIE